MNEEMKNQTEQLPLLKVHMMGSFFLEYGDQPISFRKQWQQIDETSADFPL